MQPNHLHGLCSRREMLHRMGAGFGTLGLAGVLAGAGELAPQSAIAASQGGESPLSPRPPHFAPKAKRVIQLFMPGGSHASLWEQNAGPSERAAKTREKRVAASGPLSGDKGTGGNRLRCGMF